MQSPSGGLRAFRSVQPPLSDLPTRKKDSDLQQVQYSHRALYRDISVVFCQGAQPDFPSLRIPQRLVFGAGLPTGWNPGSTNTTNEGQQDRQTQNLYFGEYPEK